MEPAGLAGALGELGGTGGDGKAKALLCMTVDLINTVHLGYTKCLYIFFFLQ